MNFCYSKQSLAPGEARLERIFEIIPGLASWTILAGMTVLSVWRPLWAAVIIIVFNLYWVLRLFYVTLFLVLSYLRLSAEAKTDWSKKIHDLGHATTEPFPPSPDQIVHLVIIPAVKETRQILEPGIKSLLQGKFSPKQILVILAVEERADPAVQRGAEELKSSTQGKFFDFLVITHPDSLPGEARVKGANATYAAKQAAEYFQGRKIPFENVIVSCFDADTVASPDYFACLTYAFMASAHRQRASFQPIPVYHNNIWEVPAFARVLEIGSSFFQLAEATYPEKLVTFSSHSMSFRALVDVGFWPVDMISDDSAIFWKAFIYFDGDYRVIPLYTTLSMDVAEGKNWRQTAVNIYKQKRRWAWGVENFPIVMRAFLKADRISLRKKITHGFKLLEGHLAWSTWAFLLTVVTWLPALLAHREFSSTVIYYSAPRITATIFRLATLSLAATIVLSLSLLPKNQSRFSFGGNLIHALEWLLVPVIAVFFSAMPALDAQTRLMLGKPMEFWVTDKQKKSKIAR